MPDVIIIGGGPAGSTMGCYLSMAGIDNMIIESANHPREHIGESLVTSTMIILQEIGVLDGMDERGYVRKHGAVWHPVTGGGAFHNFEIRNTAIKFREFPDFGIDKDYTYHVDRSKFDLMLLKRAEALGSRVLQGVHAKQVLFNGEQVSGVRVALDGQEIDLSCKVVVDASGRNTLIGRQMKLKIKDPIFNQYAVHSWFKNADRGKPEFNGYIHIYFLPVERGWAWQIPITDEITSYGVVAEKAVFANARQDLESYFFNQINANADLKVALSNATRVKGFIAEGDYSYKMERFVGNGWVLVGDAARFVDPIFSSGVSVAMFSAKFASNAIQQAFAAGDFSQAMFLAYEQKLRNGVEIWYEFIRLYYRLIPLFTHFIRRDDFRLDIMQLLQGLVFDRGEVTVLDAMRHYIEAVEKSETHLLRPNLRDVPID